MRSRAAWHQTVLSPGNRPWQRNLLTSELPVLCGLLSPLLVLTVRCPQVRPWPWFPNTCGKYLQPLAQRLRGGAGRVPAAPLRGWGPPLRLIHI